MNNTYNKSFNYTGFSKATLTLAFSSPLTQSLRPALPSIRIHTIDINRTGRFILYVILLNIALSANAQIFEHKDYKLFKLALDIRKINDLDIYSHSLSYSSELSEGLIGSTLVLPHKIGKSFEISTKSIFIYIDPVMVNYFSTNDWAFMIGHEFSHLLHARDGLDSIELEKLCDINGAKYAIGAGYNLSKYLVTLKKFGDNCSATHGCMKDRLRNLQNHFKLEE